MRIAIVNDMALACEALRRVVKSDPAHDVVWIARDGAEAIERARQDRPDLILMDLMMPKVDGAEATRRIMAESPCPILVVTATVRGHMNKVYEAMGHGALDAVDTPTLGPAGELAGASALLGKIAVVAKLIGQPLARCAQPAASAETRYATVPLVLFGASTGGPNALAEIVGGLPRAWDACALVVQHVDAAFAPGLAQWLTGRTGLRVELAEEGDRPAPGRLLLAATNDHLVMTSDRRLSYAVEPKDLCFRPSVDILFASVAAHWPDPGVAVLLTGMGRDGAEGLHKLRRLGWHTIAQDEATSVVWGMPRVAVERGAAAQVLPVGAIAGAVVEAVRSGVRGREG